MFASLGLRPGFELADVEPRPLAPSAAELLRVENLERDALPRRHKRRVHRSREESRLLAERIAAALRANESRPKIALRENVCVSYVDAVGRRIGLDKRRANAAQLQVLADKAHALLDRRPMPQKQEVADLLGVSSSYLCHILKRYPKTTHDHDPAVAA